MSDDSDFDDFKPSSSNTVVCRDKKKNKSKRSEVLKVKDFEVTDTDDRNTNNTYNSNFRRTRSRKRQKNRINEDNKSTGCSDAGDDDRSVPSLIQKRRLTRNSLNERNQVSSIVTSCDNKNLRSPYVQENNNSIGHKIKGRRSENDHSGSNAKITEVNDVPLKIISISDESDGDDFKQSQNMKSFPMFSQQKPVRDINKKKSNNATSMASRMSPRLKLSPNKKSAKTKKKMKDLTLAKEVEGCCPFCQMPFSALGIQSPDWHTMECMDLPFITESECEYGMNCDSTIPSHYRRYRHSELAAFRANLMETPMIQSHQEEMESSSSLKIQNCSASESRIDSVSSSTVCEVDIVKNKAISPDEVCERKPLDTQGNGSDEDIFNVDTPETPNFFLNGEIKSPSISVCSENEPCMNLMSEVGGGFIDTEKKNTKVSDECIYISTSKSTTASSSISTSSNIIPKLSNSTKQTSLFSFFQNKSKKPPLTKIQTDSNSLDLKKVKKLMSPISKGSVKINTDQWGSLKRQTSKITVEQPTTDEKEFIFTNGDSGKNVGDSYNKRKYSCPFYKRIPETSLTVDAFRYGYIPGCKAYILTHFHYDHYNGLTRKFQQPIYCSKITGNLVESKLKVENKYIHRLPMNQPCFVEGVELILREANHCPGAVIIFMTLPNGRRILHTGDYRAHPSMEEYPELKEKKIHDLYLDTTYCNPEYAFPYQEHVIEFAIKIAQKTMKNNPDTCIVCGTYTIGKERVFKAVANAINSKVCVKKDKKSIIDCLEDEELNKIITLDPMQASVHVLPMKLLNFNSLCDYLEKYNQFNSILVFEPTGWTHNKKIISLDHVQPKYSRNGITHYGIPYSEHSSFLELKRFVQFLKPVRILPTVNNGNPTSRRKMEELFAEWLKETENTSITKQASLTDWVKD